jgi:hypothetical protein
LQFTQEILSLLGPYRHVLLNILLEGFDAVLQEAAQLRLELAVVVDIYEKLQLRPRNVRKVLALELAHELWPALDQGQPFHHPPLSQSGQHLLPLPLSLPLLALPPQ